MTLFVFLAVLASAVMHASWNAVVKVQGDRFASITRTTFGMTLATLPILPFVPLPGPSVWPWIVASVIIHIGYRLFLIRAYEHGDLAQAYPLARGTAPLITAIGGIFMLSEVPSHLALVGILLLSLGTLLMSLRGHIAVPNRAVVANALTTSLCIAAYTLCDGSGVRLAPTAISYAVWLFFWDGLIASLIGFFYRGRSLIAAPARDWLSGILAGVLSATAYAIAMWAMTRAPVASVAALRETSILFAMLISVVALGERMTAWRSAAALAIVAGVVALRLG